MNVTVPKPARSRVRRYSTCAFAAIILFGAVLAPSLLQAQRRGTIEVGGFAHYTVLDDDDLLGKRSVGVGARLGVFALPSLSLEGEYSLGTIKDNVRGVDSWIPFRGYAVGHTSLTSSTRLFLGVGYKFERWVHDQTDNEYEFAFTALVGVRKCLGTWSVRPELAYDRNPSAHYQTSLAGTSQYFAFRVGLSRFYGPGSGTCGESERPVSATRPASPSPVAATRPASPHVSATLSASPSSVVANGSTTLTWGSMNARTCAALRPRNWTTKTATSGSDSVQVQAETTYWILCRGPGGRDSASATVSIFIPPPPSLPPPAPPPPRTPTVTLGGATTIDEGENTTLSWTSTDATSCSTQSPQRWGGSTGTTGNTTVSPGQNTTYTIQCTGPGGTSNTASATVEVRIRPRTISILGSALIRFDSANVNPGRPSTDPVVRATMDSLNMLANRMNNAPTANVVVVGNTDYVGSDAQNDAVSDRRARAVYAYLRSRVTDRDKLANTIVWSCGERNANQAPPQPPERERGRFVDRNVTVYVNQPDNVIRAPGCRQIMP